MSSFEERYILRNPSALQRIARDLRLLRDSAGFLFLWATKGRVIRKQLTAADKGGDKIVLDELISGKRE